jgi:hypothetical protein
MFKLQHRWIWFALAMLPAIIPLALILTYGVNVPFWDDWMPDIVGIYIKAHHHQLTFADLAAQHNEHRILVPRIIYLVLGSITNGNMVAPMLANWVAVVITAADLLLLSRFTLQPLLQTDQGNTESRFSPPLLLGFLASTLLFTPIQGENWIWATGLANFVPELFIFTSLLVCCLPMPRGWPKVLTVILLNVAATFSSGNGFLAWPLSTAMLAWSGSWQEFLSKKWKLGALLLAGAISVALYFVGYVKPPIEGGDPDAGGLGLRIIYFFTFLGGLFAFTTRYNAQDVGLLLGVIMFLFWVGAGCYWIFVSKRFHDQLFSRMTFPWLLVGGFAVLTGLLAAKARGGLGVEQALASRYVTFSLYLPLSLVYLVPIICNDLRHRFASISDGATRVSIQLPAMLASALIAIQVLAMSSTLNSFRSTYFNRQRAKACVMLINVLPNDPLLQKYVSPYPQLHANANALNQMGYLSPKLLETANAVALPTAAPSDGVIGSLELMAQPAQDRIVITGWAYIPPRNEPASGVVLAYDNAQHQPIIFAAAETGIERHPSPEDVRSASSGWMAAIPVATLPSDVKDLQLSAWAIDVETGRVARLKGSLVIRR